MLMRLAYISTLSDVAGGSLHTRTLVNIMSRARASNKAQDISGVLIVSGNSCLQVLEGESSTLGTLMYKISRDDRHHDVNVIYKIPTDERLFNDWSMRLLSKGTQAFSDVVTNLYQTDKELRASKSGSLARRLNKILSGVNLSNSKNVSPDHTKCEIAAKSYGGKHLSIRRWPKATDLRISNRTARLCSALSGAGVSYEELCAKSIYPNTSRLTECLDALDLVGVLIVQTEVKSNRSAPEITHSNAKPIKKPDRFSQMLRSFISTAVK